LKPIYAATIAGAAIAAIVIVFIVYLTPIQRTTSYHSGNITLHVLEDSSRKFLAQIENHGPTLENAGAFAVKKGLNDNCEPQGIVVTNFQAENRDGRQVMNPSSIPANGTMTIDSTKANLSIIPPSMETTVYVFRMDPSSLLAQEVLHEVRIQQSNSTELEQYEDCLAGRGYPLLLKLTGLQKDSQAYFTIIDDNSGEKYETSFSLAQNAPDFPAIYWPDRQNWLQANFTRQSGPAPLWQEPQALDITVKTVVAGKVEQFEARVTPELRTTSLDFVEAAKGNVMPIYPRYWEIEVDLAEKSLG
jgi:hypothetical protein